MASVYEVDGVVIKQEDEMLYSFPVSPLSAVVTTSGPQGPPGVQNVFAQATSPALQYNWGQAQKGFIWIGVNI